MASVVSRGFRSGVAAVAALGAATAAAQPEQPQPQPPAAERTVDDPLLAPPPAAPTTIASWADARRLLASSSLDVRRAEAAAARADALARQAGAALLPSARFTAAAELDLLHPGTAPGIAASADTTPTSPLVTATATATLPLVDIGARRGRAAAHADQRGAELTRLDTERRATRDLARTILAVRAAERAAELHRLGLQQALERAALTRFAHQVGAATQLDVVRIAQDVAVARGAVILGDDGLHVAREALALVLGVPGEVGIARELTGDQLVAELSRQCRALAGGEARADIAASAAAIEAAELRTAQARAGYLPTLDVSSTAFAYTASPDVGRVPSWTAALTLSLPLWEGGLRAGLIAERRAAATAARVEAERVRREVGVEVARARRGGGVARALLDTATESRDLANQVDALTRRSFEMGRATSLELVQSAGALRQAELTTAVRRYEWDAARVDELLTEARCDR